jgi:anti-sigma factor RsiW
MTEHPGFEINCIDLVELVTDYLEGALDDGTRATIDAHLETCAHCAEYIEQMRLTIRSLGHVPLEPALDLPDDVRDRLLAAFRAEPQ